MGNQGKYGWSRWARLGVIVLALALAIGLAACGDDDGDGDEAAAPTDAPTTAPAAEDSAATGDAIVVRDAWVRATASMPGAGMGETPMNGDEEPSGMGAMDTPEASDNMGDGEDMGDAMSEESGTMDGMASTGAMSAAYMVLENPTEQDERLVAVASDVTDTVEIHETTIENDVMRMRPIDGVDIPAGGSATLEPGGKHIMLINVPALEAGQTVTLTLTFESGLTQTVEAPVRPLE